ncbi:MAG: hypothetical protein ISS66_20235 [Desulfobacteraceae bacterium]|nr:hypothetical protein [Desulfobacteraceae bacterium]
MVYLKKIKEKMGPVTELSVSSFIDRHRYAEGYLRRLLLIGLRLNAVQYKQAQKIIEFSYMNAPALIEKLFILISHRTFTFKEATTKYSNFAASTDLFLKFTSPYRNWLVHGVIDTIYDLQLLEYLCRADRQFLIEFEKLLKSEFNRSAFDAPGDWGAQKGKQKEDLPAVIRRLRLGTVLRGTPMSITEAKKRLEALL